MAKSCNPENLGRVVRCVRIFPGDVLWSPLYELPGYVCWVVDPPLLDSYGGQSAGIPDAFLVPLCDLEEGDEQVAAHSLTPAANSDRSLRTSSAQLALRPHLI